MIGDDDGAKSAAQPPDRAADSLARLIASAGGEGAVARPVESWDPPYCGDIGLKILRDGTWIYGGSPIGRPALVKLFASILRKDSDARTYLVTPAEKVDVAVEDAPFLGVEVAVSGAGRGQMIALRTNVDDVVTIGPDHPIRFVAEQPDGGLKPYVKIRGRLEALCTRAVYVEIVALAAIDPNDENGLGFWSGGAWWTLAANASQ